MKDLDMCYIGERIKKRRIALRLTQTDIYEQCGIASGVLSRIENGKNVPSAIAFYKLSEVLQCDMNWLLTGDSKNSTDTQLSSIENSLLNGFRQLNDDDREDIIILLNTKLRRLKRDNRKLETLSNSQALPDTYLKSAE